jgi:hypothetical protein
MENGLTSVSYPNPFTNETKIRYDVPKPAWVRLEIYSLLGERVAVVEDAYHEPGTYETSFQATGLASGTYFYRVVIGDQSEVRTLIKQ